MKVVHVFPIFKQGGVPSVIYNLASAFERDKFFFAATEFDSGIRDRYASIGHVVSCDTTRFSIKTIWSLRKLVLREKIDILHGHGKSGLLYGIILKCLIPKLRVLNTFHGFIKPNSVVVKFMYFLAGFLFDKFVVLCPSEYDAVCNWNPKIKAKLLVVPNPVPKPSKRVMQDIIDRLSDFDLNFVSLSRMDPQKDILSMLDLVENLLASNARVSLSIYGGVIPMHQYYKDQVIKRVNDSDVLRGSVFVLGELDRASDILHMFDVYLSCARWEGLPTAIIEAMWSKLPVVCTKVQGNVDLIRHAETGFLFLPGNFVSFLEAINLLGNKVIKNKVVGNALLAAEAFEPKNIKQHYQKLYK